MRGISGTLVAVWALAGCSIGQCQGGFTPLQGSARKTATVSITMNVNHLWWFNGCEPQHYPIDCVLTAHVAATGTFLWYVASSGPGNVSFARGQQVDSKVVTDANTVTIYSTARSGGNPDVVIKLEHPAGTYVGKITLQVLTAASQVVIGRPDSAHGYDPGDGYVTEYHYKLLDQNGTRLPQPIEVNEWWDTAPPNAPVQDEPADWTWTLMPGGLAEPDDFEDDIGRWGPAGHWHPQPEVPGPYKTPRRPCQLGRLSIGPSTGTLVASPPVRGSMSSRAQSRST